MHEGVLKVLTQNEGYQVGQLIAQGDFAEVYKAKNKWGATLALKISREPCLAHLERNTPLWQELSRIGEMFSSRHLVLPIEIKDVHNHLVLVKDLLKGRTLEEELAGLRGEGKKGLPAEKALVYMADVAEALAVLHAKDFVHGFLSPDKIYRNGDSVQVVDAGLGPFRIWFAAQGGPPVRWEFLPPQISTLGKPSRAVDVYSFAACYVYLRTGEPPRSPSKGKEPEAESEPFLPEGLEEWEKPILRRILRLRGDEDRVPGPFRVWWELARRYEGEGVKRHKIKQVRMIKLPPGTIEPAVFHRLRPGGILQLGPGTYKIADTIRLWKPVHIRGSQEEPTIINYANNRSRFEFMAPGASRLRNLMFASPFAGPQELVRARLGRLIVRDACFTGQFARPPESIGIAVTGCARLFVDKCRFLVLYIGVDASSMGRIVIQKSVFSGNQNCGLAVVGRCRGRVIGNKIDSSGQQGIYIGEEARAFVWDNTLEKNEDNGIACFDNCRVRLIENKCVRNAGGIMIASARSAEIIGNKLGYNETGLILATASVGLAYGNKCCRNTGFGIFVDGSQPWHVRKNVCSRNREGGIEVRWEPDNDSQSSGPLPKKDRSSWEQTCTIRDNFIRKNSGPGILLTGSGAPVVIGNCVTENREAGIRVGGHVVSYIINNVIRANGQNGLEVLGQSAPILRGNICRDNRLWGILYAGQSRGQAVRNLCRSNLSGGILISEKSAPLLTRNVSRSNQGPGCLIQDQARAVLINNRFCDNAGGIRVADNVQAILIANRCRHNRTYGICLSSEAAGFLGWNKAKDNGEADLALPAEERRWPMLDNSFEKVTSESQEGPVSDLGRARRALGEKPTPAEDRNYTNDFPAG